MQEVKSVLEFMLILGNLKKNKRTGWILRHIKAPESISDHMYRMAIFAMLLNDGNPEDGNDLEKPPFDKSKCMKICLVHDMCEAIVGDITPHCGVSVEDKHRQEKEAMVLMCGKLDKKIGEEILSLYEEYETQTTPESQVAKDLDRFEMILQAYEYEASEKREENPQFLEEFFESTKGKFNNPQIQDWVKQLYDMRLDLHNAKLNGNPTGPVATNGTTSPAPQSS